MITTNFSRMSSSPYNVRQNNNKAGTTTTTACTDTPTTVGTSRSQNSSSPESFKEDVCNSYQRYNNTNSTSNSSSHLYANTISSATIYSTPSASESLPEVTASAVVVDVKERQVVNNNLDSFSGNVPSSIGTSSTIMNGATARVSTLNTEAVQCFPLDLDLEVAYQQHQKNTSIATSKADCERSINNEQQSNDFISIQELQSISREARSYLMELTVSREGRELQRWGHLGLTSSSSISNTGATTTAAGAGSTGSSFHSISSDFSNDDFQNSFHQEQQLLQNGTDDTSSSHPNCRLTTGCIPILPGGRILLISSSKSSNIFVLPKGGWEHNESLPLAALRETLEEAGVTGLLGLPLPPLTYETKKSVSRRLLLSMGTERTTTAAATGRTNSSNASTPQIVTSDSPVSVYHTHNRLVIFPLYVQYIYNQWPEENRLRRIVTIDEAVQLLQHRPEFLHMIKILRDQNLHQIGGL